MSRPTKILVPFILALCAASPFVPAADAATVSSLSLSVTGTGRSALFRVDGLVNWNLFTDRPTDTWQLEFEFHGMDSSHSNIVATWVLPLSRGTGPRTIIARSFDNRTRWANEDPDSWFNKKRDEIRVIVYLRRNGVRTGPGALSNEVRGNF